LKALRICTAPARYETCELMKEQVIAPPRFSGSGFSVVSCATPLPYCCLPQAMLTEDRFELWKPTKDLARLRGVGGGGEMGHPLRTPLALNTDTQSQSTPECPLQAPCKKSHTFRESPGLREAESSMVRPNSLQGSGEGSHLQPHPLKHPQTKAIGKGTLPAVGEGSRITNKCLSASAFRWWHPPSLHSPSDCCRHPRGNGVGSSRGRDAGRRGGGRTEGRRSPA